MARKIIAADLQAAEVRIFAHFSGDVRLQSVFTKGEDIYSRVAIDVFDKPQFSAHPDDPNFLKRVAEDLRNKSKVFCFTDSTMVEVQGKGLMSIKDVKVLDLIKTSSGFKTVTNLFNRKSKVKRLITNKSMFKVTDNHPFWSKSKAAWVEVKDLVVSEELQFEKVTTPDNNLEVRLPIRSYQSVKENNLPNSRLATLDITTDWAWAIGAFLGDGLGSYTNKKWREKSGSKATHITSYVGLCGLSCDQVMDKWNFFMNSLGFEPKKKITRRGRNRPLELSLVYSGELVRVFEDTLNLIVDSKEEVGNTSGRKNLRVPMWMFNASYDLKLAFIAGLFDTDGYLKSTVSKSTSDVQFCSKSFDFISDVSNLLNSMGISNTPYADWNKTYERYYYLIRVSQDGIYKLAQLGIGKYMTVPRKMQAFEDRLKTTPRDALSKTPCLVKNIIDMGEEVEVYDITVSDVHEFIANGTRVHNCLQVPYGAEGYQVAAGLNLLDDKGKIDSRQGDKVIDKYLSTYPSLRRYMVKQELMFKKQGYVQNLFGRIRRFDEAHILYKRYGDKLLDSRWAKMNGLDLERRAVKKALNAAKNFPIQSVCSGVINRAMIEMGQWIEESKVDCKILLNIHDELCYECDESIVELVCEKLKYYMENNKYAKMLSVPLVTNPMVADNLAEAK